MFPQVIQKQDVHKEYFPFGEVVPREPLALSTVALNVAKVAATVLASCAVGALVAGSCGAVIGAGISLCCVAIHQVASVFLDAIYGHYPERLVAPENDPKPGQYQTADVRILDDATMAHEWKKQLIVSAEESIELSGSYAGGDSFIEILHLIADNMASKPRLKAHLLISSALLTHEDQELLSHMKDLYPERFGYVLTAVSPRLTPVPSVSENHVKLLVVDERYFQLGGTNIHTNLIREEGGSPITEDTIVNPLASLSLSKGSRDLDMAGCCADGQLARVMRRQFFNLYHIYEARQDRASRNRFFEIDYDRRCESALFHNELGLVKEAKLKVLCGGPEHGEKNPITEEYVKRIKKAKESIHLAHMLFTPVESIAQALEDSPAQKVCISNGAGEGSFVRMASVLPARANYGLLDNVYEYDKEDLLYHRKVGLFDGVHTMLGSYNLGNKSHTLDHEIAVVIKSKKVHELCLATLNEDITNATPVTVGPLTKAAGRVIAPLVAGVF